MGGMRIGRVGEGRGQGGKIGKYGTSGQDPLRVGKTSRNRPIHKFFQEAYISG